MTPAELIKAQAEKVTGFDKLTMADHYEAIAKMLRKEAGEVKSNPVAELRAWKEKAREKGAAAFSAMGKMKQDQFNKALEDGGWKHTATFAEHGIEQYAKPKVPGTRLLVKNGKFREYAGDTMLCDWTDTKYLQSWVDSKKKK